MLKLKNIFKKKASLSLKCIVFLFLSLSLAVTTEPSMCSCCMSHIATFFSGMLIRSCWSQKPQEAHFLASVIRNTILPLPSLEYQEYSEGLEVPPLSFPYDVTLCGYKGVSFNQNKSWNRKRQIFLLVYMFFLIPS